MKAFFKGTKGTGRMRARRWAMTAKEDDTKWTANTSIECMVTNNLKGRRKHPASKLQLDITRSTKGSSTNSQRHQDPVQRHPLRRGLVYELHSLGGKVHRLRDASVQSRLHLLRPLEEIHPGRAIRCFREPNTTKRPDTPAERRDPPTNGRHSGAAPAAPRTTTITARCHFSHRLPH